MGSQKLDRKEKRIKKAKELKGEGTVIDNPPAPPTEEVPSQEEEEEEEEDAGLTV